jgi:hypothetical protein
MEVTHVRDNIDMMTGWPGHNAISYNFETGRCAILVNEHDDPDTCL